MAIGIGIGLPFRRSSTVAKRGNTVGVVSVTPENYITNDNSTTYTVGLVGANYTSLNSAYSAASAGQVIEIIDDEITLLSALIMTKGVDGNGKSIKIKGKPAKSTVVLYDTAYSLATTTSGASIEFENIIFKVRSGRYPFRNEVNTITGHVHFINCIFDGGLHFESLNCREWVMDNVEFINQVSTQVLYLQHTAAAPNSKIICNNIKCDYLSIDYFLLYSKTTGINATKLSITNSDIYVKRNLTFGVNDKISHVSIRGNKIGCAIGAGIGKLGVEATTTDIEGYAAYNESTSYIVGDCTEHLSNLWQALQPTINNAPNKNSEYWKVAELVTGEIENNLVYRTTYAADGHGLFVGFGCYNFSINNNIVTNYWYNFVIKGYNNTIQYNCAGKGFRGFSFFANNQAIISNNTSRTEDDYGLQLNVQSTGGTAVDDTNVLHNIFTTVPNGDNVIIIANTSNNTYKQNILYGDQPNASFQGQIYNLEVGLELDQLRAAMNDSKLKFINPQYEGSDDLLENYYKPTNSIFKRLRDENGQCVGAVDVLK